MTRLFLAALLLWGCSSESDAADVGDAGAQAADAAAEPAGPPTCKSMAERCESIQKACEEQDDGPACVACDEGEHARAGRECVALAGDLTEHLFDTIELAPSYEMDGLCQSWTIGNDDTIWLNALELFNDGGYHHSNWFFVPEAEFAGDDGAWTCGDRSFSEALAAVLGGVLYAQSTQALRETQKFPDGVAIRIPPRSKIVGATHLLNFRAETFSTQFRMRLYGLAEADVEVPLAFMRLNYGDLTIPPGVESEFFGECDMEAAKRRPLDADLYWVLPHYHALGSGFTLDRLGGPNDGERIFEIGGFNAEAQGRMFDPPISLSGSRGLRFACRYLNDTGREVRYGIGDQEMCVMLAFMRSDYFYDGLVNAGERVDEVDGLHRHTGPCSVFAGDAGKRNTVP